MNSFDVFVIKGFTVVEKRKEMRNFSKSKNRSSFLLENKYLNGTVVNLACISLIKGSI